MVPIKPRYTSYFKLYAPASSHDSLVAECAVPVIEAALSSGTAHSWLFVRYEDPKPHVRLRLFSSGREDARELKREFPKKLRQRFGGTLAIRTSRYRPEFTRYGGNSGVRIAERIFDVSSRAAIAFLNQRRSEGISRLEFGLVSGEALLEGLGFSRSDRDRIFGSTGYLENPPSVEEVQARLGPGLERLVREPRRFWNGPRSGIGRTVREFYANVESIRKTYAKEIAALPVPLYKLAFAYHHMHMNRIGLDRLQENILLIVRAGAIRRQAR